MPSLDRDANNAALFAGSKQMVDPHHIMGIKEAWSSSIAQLAELTTSVEKSKAEQFGAALSVAPSEQMSSVAWQSCVSFSDTALSSSAVSSAARSDDKKGIVAGGTAIAAVAEGVEETTKLDGAPTQVGERGEHVENVKDGNNGTCSPTNFSGVPSTEVPNKLALDDEAGYASSRSPSVAAQLEDAGKEPLKCAQFRQPLSRQISPPRSPSPRCYYNEGSFFLGTPRMEGTESCHSEDVMRDEDASDWTTGPPMSAPEPVDQLVANANVVGNKSGTRATVLPQSIGGFVIGAVQTDSASASLQAASQPVGRESDKQITGEVTPPTPDLKVPEAMSKVDGEEERSGVMEKSVADVAAKDNGRRQGIAGVVSTPPRCPPGTAAAWKEVGGMVMSPQLTGSRTSVSPSAAPVVTAATVTKRVVAAHAQQSATPAVPPQQFTSSDQKREVQASRDTPTSAVKKTFALNLGPLQKSKEVASPAPRTPVGRVVPTAIVSGTAQQSPTNTTNLSRSARIPPQWETPRETPRNDTKQEKHDSGANVQKKLNLMMNTHDGYAEGRSTGASVQVKDEGSTVLCCTSCVSLKAEVAARDRRIVELESSLAELRRVVAVAMNPPLKKAAPLLETTASPPPAPVTHPLSRQAEGAMNTAQARQPQPGRAERPGARQEVAVPSEDEKPQLPSLGDSAAAMQPTKNQPTAQSERPLVSVLEQYRSRSKTPTSRAHRSSNVAEASTAFSDNSQYRGRPTGAADGARATPPRSTTPNSDRLLQQETPTRRNNVKDEIRGIEHGQQARQQQQQLLQQQQPRQQQQQVPFSWSSRVPSRSNSITAVTTTPANPNSRAAAAPTSNVCSSTQAVDAAPSVYTEVKVNGTPRVEKPSPARSTPLTSAGWDDRRTSTTIQQAAQRVQSAAHTNTAASATRSASATRESSSDRYSHVSKSPSVLSVVLANSPPSTRNPAGGGPTDGEGVALGTVRTREDNTASAPVATATATSIGVDTRRDGAVVASPARTQTVDSQFMFEAARTAAVAAATKLNRSPKPVKELLLAGSCSPREFVERTGHKERWDVPGPGHYYHPTPDAAGARTSAWNLSSSRSTAAGTQHAGTSSPGAGSMAAGRHGNSVVSSPGIQHFQSALAQVASGTRSNATADKENYTQAGYPRSCLKKTTMGSARSPPTNARAAPMPRNSIRQVAEGAVGAPQQSGWALEAAYKMSGHTSRRVVSNVVPTNAVNILSGGGVRTTTVSGIVHSSALLKQHAPRQSTGLPNARRVVSPFGQRSVNA